MPSRQAGHLWDVAWKTRGREAKGGAERDAGKKGEASESGAPVMSGKPGGDSLRYEEFGRKIAKSKHRSLRAKYGRK